MKYSKIILSLAALTLALTSCKKDFEQPVQNIQHHSGDADFSKYIAIGNSLTAGYADDALYRRAQQESYPAIIANAMRYAGGGVFSIPLMPDNSGGFANLGVSGRLKLQTINGNLTPVPLDATGDLDDVSGSGPYQNMGVPGAKVSHLLLPGYGSAINLSLGLANPYFVRFASSPSASVMTDVMAQAPTFFSLWIGANDVLGYATTGGTGDSITSPATFQYLYDLVLSTLVGSGAQGVVANIPNVTDIPFFTTVPHRFIPLSDGQVDTLMAPQLMGGLSQIINSIDPTRNIRYVKGEPNAMLIKDKSLSDISVDIAAALMAIGRPAAEANAIGYIYGQARMTREDDLVLLTAMSGVGQLDSTILALGGPSAAPLAIVGITAPTDALVLDPGEQAQISSAISSYNATILSLASQAGLAFVDANTMMKTLKSESGMRFNGVDYMTAFVTGGAFSLDGVHPTSRGYAIIANAFIQAINSTYGSTLPMVNPNDFSGIEFP